MEREKVRLGHELNTFSQTNIEQRTEQTYRATSTVVTEPSVDYREEKRERERGEMKEKERHSAHCFESGLTSNSFFLLTNLILRFHLRQLLRDMSIILGTAIEEIDQIIKDNPADQLHLDPKGFSRLLHIFKQTDREDRLTNTLLSLVQTFDFGGGQRESFSGERGRRRNDVACWRCSGKEFQGIGIESRRERSF